VKRKKKKRFIGPGGKKEYFLEYLGGRGLRPGEGEFNWFHHGGRGKKRKGGGAGGRTGGGGGGGGRGEKEHHKKGKKISDLNWNKEPISLSKKKKKRGK